jgi:hypothetical protein
MISLHTVLEASQEQQKVLLNLDTCLNNIIVQSDYQPALKLPKTSVLKTCSKEVLDPSADEVFYQYFVDKESLSTTDQVMKKYLELRIQYASMFKVYIDTTNLTDTKIVKEVLLKLLREMHDIESEHANESEFVRLFFQ